MSFGTCFARYGLAAFGSVLLVGALWPRSGAQHPQAEQWVASQAPAASAAPAVPAAPADEPVSWQNEIRPLLGEKCLLCHGPDPSSREADLRLDSPAGYLADLGGYAAVAPGDDDLRLNEEYVCLENWGAALAEMTGWHLRDEGNHVYTFGPTVLAVGARLWVHSGSGADTAEHLYWGRTKEVWNDTGDTVYLYDAAWNPIDEHSY